MDTTQLLLTVVLSLSTCLLIVIGIQLIFVLKELRKALIKVNKMVEGFESLGTGLDHGLAEVTGFMNGFKTLMKVVDFVVKKKDEK
jgi:hypothetical protein